MQHRDDHPPASCGAGTGAGATTQFSFCYCHPEKPRHPYNILIRFDGATARDRYRLEIRDADSAHEAPLSSGPLLMRYLKAAVDALPLVAHITAADRGRHIAGRRVYCGWCRPVAHCPREAGEHALGGRSVGVGVVFCDA